MEINVCVLPARISIQVTQMYRVYKQVIEYGDHLTTVPGACPQRCSTGLVDYGSALGVAHCQSPLSVALNYEVGAADDWSAVSRLVPIYGPAVDYGLPSSRLRNNPH